MRPMLRPGTHVLRRAGGALQVGLDPATALVLPDSLPVRETLRRLVDATARVTEPVETTARVVEPVETTAAAEAARLVQLLASERQLVDDHDLMPLLSGAEIAPPIAAALARHTGSRASAALAARRRWRTLVRTFGHPCGDSLSDRLVALISEAGMREAPRCGKRPPDCGVLLGVGEPDRDLLDGWTRAGTPHLLVRLTEGRAVVGPFVVPGTTACLRCVDAHFTDADPAWPLLVKQYATVSARDRADGAPEPFDPLLAAVALAWAARDLASYVDGGRPTTWSGTVTLHPTLLRLETCTWLRHPACGCNWG